MKLPQSTLTSLAPWWRRLLALAELAGDLEQKDIADRLGVRPAAVGAWKNRGLEPRPDRLRKATDELFGQLKDIAYPLDPSDSEEPNKGTGKRYLRDAITEWRRAGRGALGAHRAASMPG